MCLTTWIGTTLPLHFSIFACKTKSGCHITNITYVRLTNNKHFDIYRYVCHYNEEGLATSLAPCMYISKFINKQYVFRNKSSYLGPNWAHDVWHSERPISLVLGTGHLQCGVYPVTVSLELHWRINHASVGLLTILAGFLHQTCENHLTRRSIHQWGLRVTGWWQKRPSSILKANLQE